MAETLTPRAVQKLKPQERIFDRWDAHTTGLGVRVFPTGAKSWTLRYRVGRRQRRLTIGDADVLSLADARQEAREKMRVVEKGGDPQEDKQERRDADTVGTFAETYITKHAEPKKKSWRVDQSYLNREILPGWKHKLMKDVTRRDVRELLDGIAERGAPIVANRVRSLLHRMWNVAIQMDVVDTNVVTGTVRPGVEQQRDRVLTPDEIRVFWAVTDTMPIEMGSAFKLRLVTAQRGGEVFGMRWQDVDLQGGWWTIPAESSKNKLLHHVALSPMAVEILTALRTHADEKLKAMKKPKPSKFVLKDARGKRQQSEATALVTIEDFRGHDLRRTAASMMASSGTNRLVISKILNHVERGVTAIYDRHSYDGEKKIALDAWARTLTAIIEEKNGAAVLPFARA